MTREPERRLIDYLGAYDRQVADLALALREIVLEEAPDAVERVYQTYTVAIWFGFGPKMKDMFCYIATATRHVNLGFYRGATMPDPNGVLEGEGKQMRHIKFKSDRDLERPYLRRYLRAAMEQVPTSGNAASQATAKTARAKKKPASKKLKR
jgi:hypothetical protein